MAVRHRNGETVTVTREGAPNGAFDVQGNPVVAASTSFAVSDVAVWEVESDETPAQPGVLVTTGLKLALPPTCPTLFASDRFTVRGSEGYQLVGETAATVWRNPFDGGSRGFVVTVRRAS